MNRNIVEFLEEVVTHQAQIMKDMVARHPSAIFIHFEVL